MYEPTKRAMIEVGMKCNLNCKFCYHHHLGDLRKQEFTDIEELKRQVAEAKFRGNNYIDISGGEPTIYPEICDLVKYIKLKNMGCRIITNGLCDYKRVNELKDAGLDEFLFSIHGVGEQHSYLTGNDSAFKRLHSLIEDIVIKGDFKFSFNTVINQHNQNSLMEMVAEFKHFGPKIWNFINFNPHYGWAKDGLEAKGVVANLKQVEKSLNVIIPILESDNIGVNLRYYPMCRIAPQYRRTVCNDLHVSFDPYEWDNNVHPKAVETHLRWAIEMTARVEQKEKPCLDCQLQYVCGGINKEYLKAVEDKTMIEAQKEFIPGLDLHDFYHYRKDNVLTLEAVK